MTGVPDVLVRNAVQAWGEAGRQWLEHLPEVVAAVAHDWELQLGEPYSLSYHWVVPAQCADRTRAVLKLGVPSANHLPVEVAALRAWDGRGAVRLLAYDQGRGALLLERAEPGTPASALVPHLDAEATAGIIAVARQLRSSPVPPQSTLEELTAQGEAFGAYLAEHPGDDPLPRHLVQRAGRLFDELCASATQRVALHGDLHHDNVLRATRQPWLAIDPHGVVGDPGYEAGAMLFNPEPDRRDPALVALVPARLDQLADGLELPIERVVAWGFVKAVLSEVWSAEDGGTPGGRALDVAVHLLPRLP